MVENPSSYKTVMVFCPYCGERNTEEISNLMELHDKTVWMLECKNCELDSVLILYDLSEQSMIYKGEDDEH